MKNLLGLALFIVTAAAACSTQTYYWAHAEKDAEQYDADNSYCLTQTRSTRAIATMPENQGGQAGTFSSGWSTIPTVRTMETRENIHRQCMIDRGWRLVTE
jgi:hypothetical protein